MKPLIAKWWVFGEQTGSAAASSCSSTSQHRWQMKAGSLLESCCQLFGISEWSKYFIHEVIPRTVLQIPPYTQRNTLTHWNTFTDEKKKNHAEGILHFQQRSSFNHCGWTEEEKRHVGATNRVWLTGHFWREPCTSAADTGN